MKTRVIYARNVNEAFPSGIYHLKTTGVHEPTRNGPCLVAPGPVITEYANPCERILWDERRDANPVFHLMEAIWMLGGFGNVSWLEKFNRRMAEYADADGSLHGAYGFRWRRHFGFDQLLRAISHLTDFPDSRRCVIAMWDPRYDMGVQSKDLPCNTHIYVDLRGKKLNMTVCCRSNDMLWGAYGANVVHFSILQEVLAWGLEVPVGTMIQMSNNFHVYSELPQVQQFLQIPPQGADMYETIAPTPLLQGLEGWQDFVLDCQHLVQDAAVGGQFTTKFFNEVAYPLMKHYLDRKVGLEGEMNVGGDWGMAYAGWLARREMKNA